MGLPSPLQYPTEAEEQADHRAKEVGQADAVRRAALWPCSVGTVEEIGVVEGLETHEGPSMKLSAGTVLSACPGRIRSPCVSQAGPELAILLPQCPVLCL